LGWRHAHAHFPLLLLVHLLLLHFADTLVAHLSSCAVGGARFVVFLAACICFLKSFCSKIFSLYAFSPNFGRFSLKRALTLVVNLGLTQLDYRQ